MDSYRNIADNPTREKLGGVSGSMANNDGNAGQAYLVAQPSGDGKGGHQSTQGDQQPGNGKPGIVVPTVQKAVAPNKPHVAQAQTQIEQPDPYQLRDLKAQEDMAYWAMWMFVAAVVTLFITGIGTLLIWRQVKLTREALQDTNTATLAMQEANRLASADLKNTIFQSRPIVRAMPGGVFKPCSETVRATMPSDDAHRAYKIDVGIENSGKSGCWVEAVWVGIDVRLPSERDDHPAYKGCRFMLASGIHLNSGQKHPVGGGIYLISQDVLDAMEQNPVELSGHAVYRSDDNGRLFAAKFRYYFDSCVGKDLYANTPRYNQFEWRDGLAASNFPDDFSTVKWLPR